MKNATSPLFRSALPAGTYITHRVIYYPLVVQVIFRRKFSPKNFVLQPLCVYTSIRYRTIVLAYSFIQR